MKQRELQNVTRRQQQSEYCKTQTQARVVSRLKHGDILREVRSHRKPESSVPQDKVPQPTEMQAEQHFSTENLNLLREQLSKSNTGFDVDIKPGVSGGDR